MMKLVNVLKRCLGVASPSEAWVARDDLEARDERPVDTGFISRQTSEVAFVDEKGQPFHGRVTPGAVVLEADIGDRDYGVAWGRPDHPLVTRLPKVGGCPPPGPSNIVVRCPNPLPPPKDVSQQ